MANKRKSSRKLALWGCKKLHCSFSSSTPTNDDFFSTFPERLTPLAFSTQNKLLSVNLTNNLIFDIQKGAFTNMTRMVRLILTRNKISRIDDNVLSGKTFWLWIFAGRASYLSIATILINPLFRFGKLGGIRLIVELFVLCAYRSTRPTSQPQVPQFGL